MIAKDIQRIIASTDAQTATKEIINLCIKDKISLLESCIEHPTKPGYKRKDILEKIKIFKSLL